MYNTAAFHPIDMQTWPMAQSFYYYTKMAPTTYTINVSIDVTATRKILKDEGYHFFPAYLYLVTRALAEQREMCVAQQGDVLGYWEHLTPLYPVFHADTKTTSLLWTAYDADFRSFNERYLQDKAQFSSQHGILTAKGTPPANAYVISCIPWFSFNSFSLHNHGIQDYYFPSLEAGAFTQTADGQTVMPLSITVHHATVEGYHLKLFLERLQQMISYPETWLCSSSQHT